MILNYPLTKLAGGGVIPPIPPLDQSAVSYSFVTDEVDDQAAPLLTLEANPSPLNIREVLISYCCTSLDINPLFSISGDIDVRISATEIYFYQNTTRNGLRLYVNTLTEFITLPFHIFFHARVNDTFTDFDFYEMFINGRTPFVQFRTTSSGTVKVPTNTSINILLAPAPNQFKAISNCYIEICDDSTTMTPTLDDFFDRDTGHIKPVENTSGGTPLVYIADNNGIPFYDYISQQEFTNRAVDKGVGHAYLPFFVALLDKPYAYGGMACVFEETPVIPHALNWYVNFWMDLSGVYSLSTNRVYTISFIPEITPQGALRLEYFRPSKSVATLKISHYTDVVGDSVEWEVSLPTTVGWANVSIRCFGFDVPPIIKINDEPQQQLGASDPGSYSGTLANRFNVSDRSSRTAFANVAHVYFYDDNNIDSNPGIDWTDLDALAANFVTADKEPKWNGVRGISALGILPYFYLNTAMHSGLYAVNTLIYSSISSTINIRQRAGGSAFYNPITFLED